MTEIDPEKFKKFIDDGEQHDCDCGERTVTEFKPAGRKWTLQDRFDIANLIDKGYTNLQIARMYEVSESSIKWFKRTRNLKRRKYRKWKPEELQEIRRLLKAGRTISQIADEYHIRYNTLERCVKYHKLDK